MQKIMVLVLTFALTACGTVHGLGTDLRNASDWAKEKISK